MQKSPNFRIPTWTPNHDLNINAQRGFYFTVICTQVSQTDFIYRNRSSHFAEIGSYETNLSKNNHWPVNKNETHLSTPNWIINITYTTTTAATGQILSFNHLIMLVDATRTVFGYCYFWSNNVIKFHSPSIGFVNYATNMGHLVASYIAPWRALFVPDSDYWTVTQIDM